MEDLLKLMENNKVIKSLITLRKKMGFTVVYVAEKMQVPTQWVVEMENSNDDQLNFGDIQKYTKAIGYKANCVIGK